MFLSPIFATTTVASVPGNIQPLALIGFAAIFLSEHITRWKVFALLLGLIGFVLIGIRATGEHGPNALFGAAPAFLSSLSAAGSKRHVQKARASREFDSLNRLANSGMKSTTIQLIISIGTHHDANRHSRAFGLTRVCGRSRPCITPGKTSRCGTHYYDRHNFAVEPKSD
jgi:drug/metabolite transporter (DMT)-like permease